jgi:hypothetical protein
MRDIILGRKEGSVNMRQARRGEKRMVEACERRILEFPLDMDEREFAEPTRGRGEDDFNLVVRYLGAFLHQMR